MAFIFCVHSWCRYMNIYSVHFKYQWLTFSRYFVALHCGFSPNVSIDWNSRKTQLCDSMRLIQCEVSASRIAIHLCWICSLLQNQKDLPCSVCVCVADHEPWRVPGAVGWSQLSGLPCTGQILHVDSLPTTSDMLPPSTSIRISWEKSNNQGTTQMFSHIQCVQLRIRCEQILRNN